MHASMNMEKSCYANACWAPRVPPIPWPAMNAMAMQLGALLKKALMTEVVKAVLKGTKARWPRFRERARVARVIDWATRTWSRFLDLVFGRYPATSPA